MDKESLQAAIIPPLALFLGLQPIEGNQGNDTPDGPHVVFVATSPFIKDVGKAISYTVPGVESLSRYSESDHKIVMSFTAISETEAESLALALRVADWFNFYGEDDLMNNDIAVTSLTEVGNRDSVNEDESRHGFDITFRVSRTLIKAVDYIQVIEPPEMQEE